MSATGDIGGPRAPRLLVSVRDADEAALAAAAGARLIDAKDPAAGALGALAPATVAAIVARLSGSAAATSAVAGEPQAFEDLVAAVAAMAATGVGLVKVAWPRAQDRPPAALARRLSALGTPVVAVFFAEALPSPDAAARAAAAGFRGAMIDTALKDGRTLLDRLAPAQLAAFLDAARRHGLMTGLAGSLRLADIAVLAPLGPDYLGFRGSLCRGGRRGAAIDPRRVREALSLLAASCHDAAVT